MKKQKIDQKFIDYLRLNISTTTWILDKAGKNEIVPKDLRHEHLLRNFKIDESIYDYYFLPTIDLLSESEFQEMKRTGFVGKKERILRPYSINIYGAYYSRSDLNIQLLGLIYSNRDYTVNGKKVKYFEDLIPYFKEYAKGFANGFNEFDNSQIKPFLTMLAEKQDYLNKVFEFVTKRIFFSHGWATLKSGFAIDQNAEIVGAFENGQKQGYFYKAWSIIFSNSKLFASLFEEHFKTFQPQQNETKTEQELPKMFEEHLGCLITEFNSELEYRQAISVINDFFLGKSISIKQPIFVKRGNTKKLAFALGEIWRSKKNEVITYEYLEFYKQAFSVFNSQVIDRNNLFGCNLYKYSISRT